MHVFDYFLCALLESLCEQAQGMVQVKDKLFTILSDSSCLCHVLTLVSDFKICIYFFPHCGFLFVCSLGFSELSPAHYPVSVEQVYCFGLCFF